MADATVVPVTPDPPPWTARAVLRQQWQELAYFHWRYDPDIVQRLLPADVTIDTFDGQAWVGLVPFEMRNVRVGPTPPIPWLGSFFEVNVRTYVVDRHGRRAVWFFSLDVPRSAIVAVARTAFALPYCWASGDHQVDGDHHRYRLQRRRPHDITAMADIDFTVGHPIALDDVTPLEHFLTARWALLTQRMGRIVHGRVDHQRWPLQRIASHRVHQSVIEAAGLPSPVGEPHTLFSPGVDVRVARFRRVPPSKET